MVKIGVTEAGDPGFAYTFPDWQSTPYPVNVIITKQLSASNDGLHDRLLAIKEKTILHVTCTGYGDTAMEPGVPPMQDVFCGTRQLINHGFPVSQIVLRTDPIIPTGKGIETVQKVWEQFSTLGIKRCRYSVIDMYRHVQERFLKTFGAVPFDGFKAPKTMMDAVEQAIRECPYYIFESCAESFADRIGCVSKRDFDILGIPYEQEDGGFQRRDCLCCAGKTELLHNKKRCPSGCLYCYWRG